MKRFWHSWELERVFQELQSQPSGLSYTAARRRLREVRRKRLPILLGAGFLLGLLLIPTIRSVVFSSRSLILSFIFGFHGVIYRYLTLAFSAKNQTGIISEAIVKRENRYLAIPSRGLVKGDIIWLRPGNKVAADVRLLALNELEIGELDQGKWKTTLKDTIAPVPSNISRSEQSNMVYRDSLVVEGEGIGVVVETYKSSLFSPFNIFRQELLLFYLSLGWIVFLLFSTIVIFLVTQSFYLVIFNLLFGLSVPLHWSVLWQFCDHKTILRLEEEKITIRSGGSIRLLSQLDTVFLDLNHYQKDALTDLGITWRGLWHGAPDAVAELTEQWQIPVQPVIEGLALPVSQCIAITSDTPSDTTLMTRADLTIVSKNSDPNFQNRSAVLIPAPQISEIVQSIIISRIATDRMERILLCSLGCNLAFILLLTFGSLFFRSQALITPLQILWSGVILPVSLTLLFLAEPEPDHIPGRSVKFFGLSWWRTLGLSLLTIVLSTVIIFQFSDSNLNQTMAWSTFNFCLLGLGLSLVRVPLIKFPIALGLSLVLAVIQVLWVQTNRSGMVSLNLVNWIIVLSAGSTVFWLNQLIRPYYAPRA